MGKWGATTVPGGDILSHSCHMTLYWPIPVFRPLHDQIYKFSTKSILYSSSNHKLNFFCDPRTVLHNQTCQLTPKHTPDNTKTPLSWLASVQRRHLTVMVCLERFRLSFFVFKICVCLCNRPIEELRDFIPLSPKECTRPHPFKRKGHALNNRRAASWPASRALRGQRYTAATRRV